MKKILLLNMFICSILLGNNFKVEDLNIKSKRNTIESSPTQYERQMLILNIPIKINNFYVRFKDIKNIEIKKDKVICDIEGYGTHCDITEVEIKDDATKNFIIELFEQQQKDIVDILKSY